MLLVSLVGMCSCIMVAPREGARPEKWACKMELEGVPNLHKVSDNLYRSAQPTAEGMGNLEKMGIKTVINLRYFSLDDALVEGTNLQMVRYRTLTWYPGKDNAVSFLKLMNENDQGPYLIHCYHGSDRTGAMCALYRMKLQGWSYEDAVDEMTHGGYGFHAIWKNLPHWLHEITGEEAVQGLP